jgi:hypothetical protein
MIFLSLLFGSVFFAKVVTGVDECPFVYYRNFEQEQQALAGLPIPVFKQRPSCMHELKGNEIAMGVFHCKKYETGRLKSVADTWGKSLKDSNYGGLRTYLLASKSGATGSIYPPSSLIVTDEPKDDYRSTLGIFFFFCSYCLYLYIFI